MQVCPDDWKSVAERELIEFGINSTLSSAAFNSNLDILDIFWSRLISSFSPVGGIEGFFGCRSPAGENLRGAEGQFCKGKCLQPALIRPFDHQRTNRPTHHHTLRIFIIAIVREPETPPWSQLSDQRFL